jgi:hypothetical protein
MTRYLMIFWFILHCLRLRVNPWRFFQLNASYFNKQKGIYSKQDINWLIPARWRLGQQFDTKSYIPKSFPVFLKPEWGQNSYGIYRADSFNDLRQIRNTTTSSELTYLVQEAAREAREFELFYIRDAESPGDFAVLTITEVKNNKENRYPINGVHNTHSGYTDYTTEFNGKKSRILWEHISKIGHFRIARVGLKADSEEDLLAGRFHIVEINLFTPMPLNLMDKNKAWLEKVGFIKKAMLHIAKNTAKVFKQSEEENIFFKKLIMHYKVKS